MTPPLFAPAVVALGLAIIVAASLLVAGLRGRRVDDHPVCRRCRFDLVGAPPGGTVCPECGADVTRAGAVRTGNRVRRTGLLAAGVPLLAVSLGGLAVGGWARVRGADLNAYKPAWLLAREAEGADPAAAGRALAELRSRVAAGKLGGPRVAELVDKALARQADASRPWAPAWGELVEAARDAGRLDDERWRRYRLQAVTFEMTARPRVRRGDPVPVRLKIRHARVGRPGRLSLAFEGPHDLVFAGVPLQRGVYGSGGQGLTSGPVGGSTTMHLRPDEATMARLPDGAHAVRGTVKATVTDGPTSSGSGVAGHPDAFEVALESQLTLLPADRPTVTRRLDPAMAGAVRQSLRVDRLVVERGGASVAVATNNPPANLAFAVSLRAGGREWPMGTVNFQAGATNSSYHLTSPADGLTARQVDVVLRADAGAAANTVDLFDIWDGEVVLGDVAVEYK